MRLAWTGRGTASAVIAGPATDLSREANGDVAMVADLRVDVPPSTGVTLNGADVATRLTALAASGGWGRISVPLKCLPTSTAGTDVFAMTTTGALTVTVSRIAFAPATEKVKRCAAR